MNPQDGNPEGLPIQELRDQELETSDAFTGRVRRSIHRRTAAGQVASYSWHLPRTALLEMTRLVTHVLGSFGAGKERNP